MHKMKKSRRAQRWPMDIPVKSRLKLETGPQTDGFRRFILSPDAAFDGQRVRLDRHLLVFPVRGNLLIQTPGLTRMVWEGSAAIVPAGEIKLTEVPNIVGAGTDIYYFLFSTRFLRRKFLGGTNAEMLASVFSREPSHIDILQDYVHQMLPAMRMGNLAFPTDFNAIFNSAFSSAWPAAFTFLKRAFFEPKRAMNLLLENLIGDPMGEIGAALTYPGGLKSLRRDCRLYTGMSPSRWLLKRRMQLARIWIRHGDKPLANIAAILAYRTWSSFVKDYRKIYRHAPGFEKRYYDLRSMSDKEFRLIVAPFWLVTMEAATSALWLAEAEVRRKAYYQPNRKPRCRRKAAVPAEAGSNDGPVAGDATAADAIQPPPEHPGLKVLERPNGELEPSSEREPFGDLKTTGAEFITFPGCGKIWDLKNADLERIAA